MSRRAGMRPARACSLPWPPCRAALSCLFLASAVLAWTVLACTALFPPAARAATAQTMGTAPSPVPLPASPAALADYPPPWPFGAVRVTVPFSRGSEADKLFSLFQAAFSERTGQTLEARYQPGRAGADAWATMADGATDGSVLTLVLLPNAYWRSRQPDSGVSLEAMRICNIVASAPSVLWVAEPTSLGSVQVMASVAAGMNGDFLVGGSGNYSTSWLADHILARETGVRTTYIPYNGTVEAARAALNGAVGAFWGYSVRVTVPSLEQAVFKPLAVAAAERVPALPTTPTFGEGGLSLRLGASFALAVPAQTPEITVTEIAACFSALVATPTFRQGAQNLGFVPMNVGPEAVPGFLESMKAAADAAAEDYGMFGR